MRIPSLSVIIPTHGRQPLVERAVASVLSQDVDLEVIVVDDASPAPIKLEAERVTVLRSELNRGAGASRNIGAAAAKADWIAFLDSDDIWTAGSLRPRLETARAVGGRDRVIWAAGFTDVWPSGARRLRVPIGSDRVEDFASGCWMCPGSTALVSKRAWDASGGQDPALRRLEDYDWLLRWALRGGGVEIWPRVAAEIARGGRRRLDHVRASARLLRRKHRSLPPSLRRRMAGFLALDLAATYLSVGRPLEALIAAQASWALHPRLQLPLERFWSDQAWRARNHA